MPSIETLAYRALAIVAFFGIWLASISSFGWIIGGCLGWIPALAGTVILLYMAPLLFWVAVAGALYFMVF